MALVAYTVIMYYYRLFVYAVSCSVAAYHSAYILIARVLSLRLL